MIYEDKYRDDPQDMLDFCRDKVTFLSEVVLMVPPGERLIFSEAATGGLHRILQDIADEMSDSLEEISQQRRGDDATPQDKAA